MARRCLSLRRAATNVQHGPTQSIHCMVSLKTALATVHRDRGWWHKVLIGGACWLSVLGYPLVEGYTVESIENTINNYPTPLPRWNDLGTKWVVGMFALVIDFTYFVFPLLLGGFVLLCGAIGLSLSGAGSGTLRIVGGIVGALIGLSLLGVWLLGLSPVGKRLYVGEGQINQALSSKVARDVWEPVARPIYLRARLHSAPVYLPFLALLTGAWFAADRSGGLALALLWLALATLVYARLVVVQLYDAAARDVQQRRFEQFRARTRKQV